MTSNTSQKTDVCILGAGMAGLTLARQLQMRQPELDITLVEHRHFPVPEATHKVGESMVEIASHYLSNTLELQDHLQECQLPKFGLRLFLRGTQPIAQDLAEYDEIGVSKVLPIPTYQLDRGRFENHLAMLCRAAGARILDGTTIRDISINKGAHRVSVRDGERESTISCRYVVDASGRRALLRRQQVLTRPARHGNHAVWYRVAGDLDLDSWSVNPDWLGRCAGSARRFSTNHFTGPGYWLWLIPLSSNATSVGLVFDPKCVALDLVNRHDKLLNWLAGEHPLVAQRLGALEPLDFHVLQDYAVGSKQTFAADGWMMTGDAGVFADPFYSPGADFIAIANSYITDLITNECSDQRAKQFQNYFLTFFSNTLSLYRGQYKGFGNRDLLVLKTLWDYAYYWASLSKLFFTDRFTDQDFMSELQPTLYRAATLNAGMQSAFRRMSKDGARVGGEGRFYDHHEIRLFHRLKEELLLGDTENAASQLCASVSSLEQLATKLHALIVDHDNGIAVPTLDQLAQAPEFS